MVSGMYGDSSATQAALIVPMPGSNHIYYIFTADIFDNLHGICYSVIDMNLNAGLGGVVSINNMVITPSCEKITAVRNSNGIDYWIIVHGYPGTNYNAYPLTAVGLGAPVITPIGTNIYSPAQTPGYLKCSTDGLKIVAVNCNNPSNPIDLFDFDNATGILYNYFPIPDANIYDGYGLSFSPDNSKIYVGFWTNAGTNITQYDLTLTNFQNFPYTVLSGGTSYHTGIQLAPDGKIYCCKEYQNTLGVINNPNLAGAACNYDDLGFTLYPSTTSSHGLPNFVDNFFAPFTCEVNLSSEVLTCANNSTDTIHAGNDYTNYLWNTGETTESITVINSGNYSVTVTTSTGCSASDTVTVTQIPPLNSNINSFTDTLNCINIQNGAIDISVNGGTGSYNYQWSNGATTEDLNNLNAGTYTVTVTDSVGCIVSNPPITIVHLNDLQVNNSSFNNLKCHDDTNGFVNVTVLNGLSPNNYAWSNGATTEDLNNLTAGTYSVTVSDAGGCTASDTVVISAPNQVIASLTTAADTVFCSVTGGTPSYHYHWSTGATTAFIDSATNGTYSVTVSDINNCTAVETITIDVVSTFDGENHFEIYPNPASEELIVKSEKLFDATISVTDILGRVIQTARSLLPTSCSLDVSNYSEGIYFIKLVSSSGVTAVKKFVVVH